MRMAINGGFSGRNSTMAAAGRMPPIRIPANFGGGQNAREDGGLRCMATVVYDGPSQTARLYYNGVQAGQAEA